MLSAECFVMVTTTNDEGMPYSDYLWHHLNVTRTGFKGEIVVDEEWTGEARLANFENIYRYTFCQCNSHQ